MRNKKARAVDLSNKINYEYRKAEERCIERKWQDMCKAGRNTLKECHTVWEQYYEASLETHGAAWCYGNNWDREAKQYIQE